jgi:hypothetical protein
MSYDNMKYIGSKDTASNSSTTGISDTLKQGLEFQKYLKKITQSGANIEAFTEYEVDSRIQELDRLKYEYGILLNNFERAGYTLRSGYEAYLTTLPNAAYTNKHVTIAGQNGYVTRNGVFKSYDGDGATFNGVNGCPTTTNRVTIAGTTLSNVLQTNGLRMGNPMVSGQRCGDEGTNVFVNRTSEVGITYSGCYQASDPAVNGLQLQAGGPIFNVNSCKQRAASTGAAVFAIRNYDASNNRASCYTGATFVSPTLLGNTYVGKNIWTSAFIPDAPGTTFQLPYYAQLKNGGFLSILDKDNKLVKQFQTSGKSTCQTIPKIYSFYVTPAAGVQPTNLLTSAVDQLNPSNLPSFSFPIRAIYPNASTNATNYTIEYACGNTNSKQYIIGGTPSTIITVEACTSDNSATNCMNFHLILKDGGKLEINEGAQPPAAGAQASPLLITETYPVTDSVANLSYLVANGITGANYISSSTPLSQNQYIASNDGKLVLIMQPDGILCLKTFTQPHKCINSPVDSQMYGGPNAYTLYNFNSPMDNSNIGKLAYIDDDGLRHAYPSSMIEYDSNHYQHFMNYDSFGNNIANMPIQNSSSSYCKQVSDRNPNSGGYVYDNNTKNCWIKNSSFTLATPKTYVDNAFLYVKTPLPIVPTSCSDTITEIDSARWNQYKTGSDMTSSFTCGSSRMNSRAQRNMNVSEAQLQNMAIEIIGKITDLQTQGVILTAEMTKFKSQLQASIDVHDAADETADEVITTNSALIGMMNDADLMVLKENSRYLFLSIFAVGALVVALNAIKK